MNREGDSSLKEQRRPLWTFNMEEEQENIDLEDEEEQEINVFEFGLTSEEIDELIGELNTLKESKQSVSFTIDEDNDLLIHHEDAGGQDEGVSL